MRAGQVADAFDRLLRHRSDGDVFDTVGRAAFEQRVAVWLDRGEAPRFLLPGFPHKNPNPAKAFGPLPDLGETLALELLHGFGEAIGDCEITLFSDGRVWGDLLGVPRDHQIAYGSALRSAATSPHVRFADLSHHLTPAQIEQGWEGLEVQTAFDAQLRADPDLQRVHARFTRLILEDRPFSSGTVDDHRETAEAAARSMMIRHRAFTALLAGAYPDHVRLSVHASTNAGPKFSVRLSPDSELNLLPYHSVVARRGGLRLPMRRDEAEASGLRRVERDGHPWCFEG